MPESKQALIEWEKALEPWPEDEDEDEEANFGRMWMPGDSLAPYVGTPVEVLDAALSFARMTPTDVVLDVGCGDGRIPIWAVLRGAHRGLGIELEAALCDRAIENARRRGVDGRFAAVCGDATDPDNADVQEALDAATLLAMYLLPEALAKLHHVLVRHLTKHSGVGARLLTLGWAPPRLSPVATAALGAHGLVDAFLFDATSVVLPADAGVAPAVHDPPESS